MSFYARTFIFNGIPSEFFNLYLGDLLDGTGSSTGIVSTDGSSNISLLTQKIYRRAAPLLYGVEQTPVLQFPFSVYCPDDLQAPDYSDVASWLFGQQQYLKLRICQPDMADVYFNCFLADPQIVRVGNIIRGATFTVICDAPWGYRIPKTYNFSWADGVSVNDTKVLLNQSDNNFYTFPTNLVITANSIGGVINITNTSDENRVLSVTTTGGEIITMNCYDQTIESSLVSTPLDNFNLNWLRLKKGKNVLNITGNILSMTMTHEIAAKIGG